MRPMIIISFQFAVPTGRRQFYKKDEAHTEEPNDSRLAPTWCFRNMCKQLRASGEREPKRDLPFWIADHHPSIQPSVCLVFLFFFSPIFSSIRMSCSLKEAVNVRRFLLYEYIPGPTWSSPFLEALEASTAAKINIPAITQHQHQAGPWRWEGH